MEARIADFEPSHVDAVLRLWSESEGVGLGDSDTPDGIDSFLRRNPGLSCIAVRGSRVVGAALCGHDGRRGYIHHLAVALVERRSGLGSRLVEECLARLRKAEILKCHVFVFRSNQFGELFWKRSGWQRREDLDVFSRKV